jgi:hypothetical protein
MWEPRRLTTLLASTACYRDSFTFLPCRPRSLSFRLHYPTVVWVCLLSHACYALRPSHPTSFDHPNNVWWEFKLWSSWLCSFLNFPVTTSPLGANIPCSQTPSMRLLPLMPEARFHTSALSVSIVWFVYLSCRADEPRLKDKFLLRYTQMTVHTEPWSRH